MRIGASLRVGFWMMAGCVWSASEADQAMLHIMRQQSKDTAADGPFRIRHGLVVLKAKPLPALPQSKLRQSTRAEFEAAHPEEPLK